MDRQNISFSSLPAEHSNAGPSAPESTGFSASTSSGSSVDGSNKESSNRSSNESFLTRCGEGDGRALPRVCIVGGGMSGVSALRTLWTGGVRDVRLYEATDRLGGRIHTHYQPNQGKFMNGEYLTARKPHRLSFSYSKTLGKN